MLAAPADTLTANFPGHAPGSLLGRPQDSCTGRGLPRQDTPQLP